MIKIVFWDKTFIVIHDRQMSKLKPLLNSNKFVEIEHLNGVDIIQTKSIAKITKAYTTDYTLPANKLQQINKPEISEEQRFKNLARLKEIKDSFMEQMNKKKRIL